MRSDPFDSALQDYLDGRMSEQDRTAFEARVEDDAELARRVRLGLELRGALRAELDGDRPAPEFYGRARARFANRGGVRDRTWFRPLSLETAGLAAAVVIAAVVFLPRMDELQRPDSPGHPVREGASSAGGEARIRVPVEQKGEAPAERVGGTGAGVNAGPAEQPRRQRTEETQTDLRFAPSPAEPEPRPEVNRPKAPATPARAEAEKTVPAGPPADELGRRDDRDRGGAPEPQPRSNERADSRAAAGARGLDEAQPAPVAGRVASAAVATVAFELPQGAVEPGEVRSVRTLREWEALGLDRAGPPGPGRRVVLIGPRRQPFSCASLVVASRGDHHEIRLLPPVDSADAATWGCGIELPDDGRSVRVLPEEADG